MTTDDRELPTAPENLKPSETTELETTIPRLRPLPAELVTAIRKLPAPNPDSYVEMSIALVLRGIENQQSFDGLLDGAVDRTVERINEDAERRAERTKEETKKNFELTNHEVQKIAAKVGELEAIVRELPPRIGKVEERLETGDEMFESIKLELAAMRSQFAGLEKLHARMDDLERELAKLREGNTNVAAATQDPPTG
jgi:DNA repair ATPase RecN